MEIERKNGGEMKSLADKKKDKVIHFVSSGLYAICGIYVAFQNSRGTNQDQRRERGVLPLGSRYPKITCKRCIKSIKSMI